MFSALSLSSASCVLASSASRSCGTDQLLYLLPATATATDVAATKVRQIDSQKERGLALICWRSLSRRASAALALSTRASRSFTSFCACASFFSRSEIFCRGAQRQRELERYKPTSRYLLEVSFFGLEVEDTLGLFAELLLELLVLGAQVGVLLLCLLQLRERVVLLPLQVVDVLGYLVELILALLDLLHAVRDGEGHFALLGLSLLLLVGDRL